MTGPRPKILAAYEDSNLALSTWLDRTTPTAQDGRELVAYALALEAERANVRALVDQAVRGQRAVDRLAEQL